MKEGWEPTFFHQSIIFLSIGHQRVVVSVKKCEISKINFAGLGLVVRPLIPQFCWRILEK